MYSLCIAISAENFFSVRKKAPMKPKLHSSLNCSLIERDIEKTLPRSSYRYINVIGRSLNDNAYCHCSSEVKTRRMTLLQ